MGVTVNNKYSKIFGDYASCTAYEVSNFPATTNYEIAGGSINTYMPTTIFANSYTLTLSDMEDLTSYIKYASSSYTLVYNTYNYSYNTLAGLVTTYADKIDNAIKVGTAEEGLTAGIYVGKNGEPDEQKTETAFGYIDLKIDINY